MLSKISKCKIKTTNYSLTPSTKYVYTYTLIQYIVYCSTYIYCKTAGHDLKLIIKVAKCLQVLTQIASIHSTPQLNVNAVQDNICQAEMVMSDQFNSKYSTIKLLETKNKAYLKALL